MLNNKYGIRYANLIEKLDIGDSIPITLDESNNLKQQLQDAVDREDYPKAVEIRNYMIFRGFDPKI